MATRQPRVAPALRCACSKHDHGRCSLHVREASLRSCCKSHQACCVLPGLQCAVNCSYCDTAGAGKCDQCVKGYGLTKSGTCALVRLLPAHGCCGVRVHEASRARAAARLTRPDVCSLACSVVPTATMESAGTQGPASAIPVLKATASSRVARAPRCACSGEAWAQRHAHSLYSCWGESHPAFSVLPGPQCTVAYCFTCDNGLSKCDECYDGYGPTKRGTCARVSVLQACMRAPGLHSLEASLRSCCCESHQAPCPLPGPQCTAAHCAACYSAGVGKCDACFAGYILTKSGTCVKSKTSG